MPLKTKTTLGDILVFAILWSLLLMSTAVHAQLKADFTPAKTSDCESLITTFADKSTGDPVSWKWDLGNGYTSTERSPSAAYTSPGVYNVSLTVKNAAGNTSTVTKTVTVLAPPQPDFTATPVNGCAPLAVTFQDKSNPMNGTITAYSWDFGDGTIGSGRNPVHTYNEELSPTVTLTVTNSNGCTASRQISNIVNVSAVLKPDFTVSERFLCAAPGTLTINNTTTGPGNISYQWDFGDGSKAVGINPGAHTYASKGVYKITLTATSDKGCTATKTSDDIVVASFNSDFRLPADVCENATARIVAINTPKADNVTWSVDRGTITTNGDTTTYYPAGTGTVKVTMMAEYGKCPQTVTKDLVVIAAPKAAFTNEIKPICDAPVQVKLINNSQGANSWSWDFGNGLTSSQQNPSVTYDRLGPFNIRLTANNAAGCSSTTSQYADLVRPVVSIRASVPQGCVGLTTRFTASITTSDEIASYEWNFGDGSPTSAEASPVHTYTGEGAYPVTLNYTTKNGCKGIASLDANNPIRTYTKPKPDFSSPEAPQVCGNNTVHFNSTTDVGNGWKWDFGDNTAAGTSRNPTHSYKNPGSYTVSLTVSNYACSETITKVDYITAVNPFPRFSMQQIDCGNRTEMKFDDRSIGTISNWKWNWGDGQETSYTSKKNNVAHNYEKIGTYKVKLTVSDGTCTSSDSMTIKVYAPSPITITADKTTLCGSDTLNTAVTAINKSIYGLDVWSYKWVASDSTPAQRGSGDYQQAVFSNLQPGKDTISFIAYNLQGCPDTSNKVALKVHGPIAQFVIPATPKCRNTALTFTDRTNTSLGKPITTWLWDFGDGTPAATFAAAPFTHTYSRSGYYYPRLTVTDQDGCTSTASGPRVQVNGPNADFTPSAVLVPPGSNIVFRNNTTITGGTPTYHWDFGDNTTSTEKSPTKRYPNKGVYTVQLVVRDENGCADSIRKQIKVSTVGANFTVTTSFVNNSSCPPVIARFKNTSTNYTSSRWDFGDGSFSTIDNPSHTYTNSGRYTVRLRAIGEAGNEDTYEQEVIVKGPYGTIATSSDGGCLTKDIEFTVSAVDAINFAWDFTDGIVTETADSIIKHTFKNPGIYMPRLILSDQSGCKGTAFLDHPIVIDKLEVEMEASPQLICSEGWISFNPKFNSFSIDELNKAATYKWTFDAGVIAENDTAANSRFYVNRLQDYTFALTTTTAYGCVQTVSKTITVYPKPLATITGPLQACQEAPVSLGGQQTGGTNVTWLWNFGNGNVATVQQPDDQTYSQTGPLNVSLIITSADGCTDTAYHNIDIMPKPIVSARAASPVLCLGNSTTLSASGAASYQWSPAEGLSGANTAYPLAQPAINTTYQVIGEDANGCRDTADISIRVAQPFTIQATPDTAVCPGTPVPLWATGADHYVWQGQGLDDEHSPYPNATLQAIGRYTYEVTGYDADGCFTHDTSLVVTLNPAPTINAGPDLSVMAGKPLTLLAQGSPDIVKWNWTPPEYLSCTTCATPEALPNLSTNYRVEVENNYGCTATDEVFVSVACDKSAIFFPNAFSPNRDGKNEYFYPKGRGVKEVVWMRVYDRWGSLVFERTHFQINNYSAGWDGTWKNQIAPIGTYVYAVETLCEEGGTFIFRGTVTVVR